MYIHKSIIYTCIGLLLASGTYIAFRTERAQTPTDAHTEQPLASTTAASPVSAATSTEVVTGTASSTPVSEAKPENPAPKPPAAPTLTETTTTIPQGSGRTLSVSPSGSDQADGISAPLKTIQKAQQLAKPGDIIEVASGSYGGLQVRNFGTKDAWITLRAKAGADVTIRGTDSGPSIYFYASGCDEYAPKGSVCPGAYWSIEGINIKGSATGGGDGNAVKIDTPFVRLVKNKLCCSVADVIKAVRTANNVTIESNEIWQDAAVTKLSGNAQGVDVTGADDLRVIGNYVHDVPDIGIYAKGNACRPLIDRNFLKNIGTQKNGANAIMLGQQTDANRLVQGCGSTVSPYFESYDGMVSNNIVISAAGACVAVSSSHNAKVYHNSCYDVAKYSHAALYISNESDAPSREGYPRGRQPSDHVEFRGNLIVNQASGRMFSDSDIISMTDWKELIISDNIYWSAKPLVFTLKQTNLYQGGTFAEWQKAYTQVSGRTDKSRTVDPLVEATTLKLQSGSPATGTAPAGLVLHDYTGATRSSTPSVGARE